MTFRDLKNNIKLLIHNKIFRPHWKYDFICSLKPGDRLLDVGCGNNSPYRYKTMQPLINYTGLDIGDYNQEKPILADEYLITCPENFAYEIEKRPSHYDSILSSHNIEHCLDRKRTLIAMMRALRPGGRLYIAFPSSRSIDFPRRQGTLNYYDDSTHIDVPPDFDEYLALLSAEGFSIDYSTKRYRPIIMRILGFINERRSKNSGIVMTGTWEYYGFESIIWARKK